LGWLKKLPIVSLLFATAIAVAPFWIGSMDGGRGNAAFEAAREDARAFLVRNPQLEVDRLGELIVDPAWLDEMRAAAEQSSAPGPIQLPARMLARSQARLDGLIADAYQKRIAGDPAWRYGVLDARSPTVNYFAHAFVHERWAGVVLGAIVVLLVGSALELAWGSIVLALFAIAAIPSSAYAYRLLDASGGLPWSGAAGLAGALVGAYFIRGLGGRFVVPGWIVLPAWLGLEAFVVRNFWIDDLGAVPWATFCAAVGGGALVSGGLRLLNVESRIQSEAAKREKRGPNPVVSRAARLRSDGDPYQAFDLIQTAWREDPTSQEVAEAFFSIAVEVGQPEAAAEAIMPSLRSALRRGDVTRAVEYWLPLATRQSEVPLEATVAVRLGEALLDAGHPTEAIFTLRGALERGVSAAQAARIVGVARDLDDAVARQAALVALKDASLDPKFRTELEAVAAVPAEAPADGPLASPPPQSASPLDRRVHAEHQAIETTAFPETPDRSDTVAAGPASGADEAADANEASLMAQSLDHGAVSFEDLSVESGGGPEGADDVLSHWNERDLGGDVADDAPGVGSGSGGATTVPFFDDADLESHGDDLDLRLDLGESDLLDPSGSETDTDLTPLIEETDEVTSPLVAGASDASDMMSPDDQSTVVYQGAPTGVAAPPSARGRTAIGRLALDQRAVPPPGVGSASPGASMRAMKALDAVPVAMQDDGIEVDASPRGKSRVPFARIQAIGMAAVKGLGQRTVLVIDLVLNGADSIDEPMKLIRFRSDRFDPKSFEPGAASPLDAIVAWVGRLQQRSNAICLPSQEILEGRFPRFRTLEDYEREVLAASREDGD
jgi:membrane associated rhomboid family serine protease